MPLSKEKMRKYMADRRARQRERGWRESQPRANTFLKTDAIGSDKCQIKHSVEVSRPEKNLPVPVLAEPQQADSLTLSQENRGQDDGGEARESTKHNDTVTTSAGDSRGGQNNLSGEAATHNPSQSTTHRGMAVEGDAPNPCPAQNFMQTPPPIESPHTTTDQLFDSKKPGYYIFEKEIQMGKDGKPRVCWYCGKQYETRMQLNKFCSPEHKDAWLTASLRRGE